MCLVDLGESSLWSSLLASTLHHEPSSLPQGGFGIYSRGCFPSLLAVAAAEVAATFSIAMGTVVIADIDFLLTAAAALASTTVPTVWKKSFFHVAKLSTRLSSVSPMPRSSIC